MSDSFLAAVSARQIAASHLPITEPVKAETMVDRQESVGTTAAVSLVSAAPSLVAALDPDTLSSIAKEVRPTICDACGTSVENGHCALIAIDPLSRPNDCSTPQEAYVTSFVPVTLTLQWTGAGSRNRRDTKEIAAGMSAAVTVAGWLGRDCDYITVSEIVARSSGGADVEVWRADNKPTGAQHFTRAVTDPRALRAASDPAAVRNLVCGHCRQSRAEEKMEADQRRQAAEREREQERSLARSRERAAAAEAAAAALNAALAPYRQSAADDDDDERWAATRSVALPAMSAEFVEQGPFYGMPQATAYSHAWLAPMPLDNEAPGGLACVYRVTDEVYDKYGSDMCPPPSHRWEMRRVVVNDATGETVWEGPATVLFREERQ